MVEINSGPRIQAIRSSIAEVLNGLLMVMPMAMMALHVVSHAQIERSMSMSRETVHEVTSRRGQSTICSNTNKDTMSSNDWEIGRERAGPLSRSSGQATSPPSTIDASRTWAAGVYVLDEGCIGGRIPTAISQETSSHALARKISPRGRVIVIFSGMRVFDGVHVEDTRFQRFQRTGPLVTMSRRISSSPPPHGASIAPYCRWR